MAGVILVTGATGTIGRSLVAQLVTGGAAVRTCSRTTPDHWVAPHVRADFAKPSTITDALEDIDVIFLNSAQHPDMAAHQGNVVDTAPRAGVRHIVKVSAGTALTGPHKPSWVGRAHAEIEARIAESGLHWTFLRPNYFMQNLLGLSAPIRAGTLPVPLNGQRVALVDTRDIAAAAAAILVSPGEHAGSVYDLTGPEALTFQTVAGRLSRAAGSAVTHVSPPLHEAAARIAEAGAPEWLQRHLTEAMTIFATDPLVAEVSADLQRITGRQPATLERFLADHIEAFAR